MAQEEQGQKGNGYNKINYGLDDPHRGGTGSGSPTLTLALSEECELEIKNGKIVTDITNYKQISKNMTNTNFRR